MRHPQGLDGLGACCVRHNVVTGVARCRGNCRASARQHFNSVSGEIMNAKNGETVEGTPRLLSVLEVAARLKVCRRTIERLVASRALPPPLKIGKASRFLETDVAAFVRELVAERGQGHE